MNEHERKALATLRFNWAPVADDVWRPAPFHISGLHTAIEQIIQQSLGDAWRSVDSSPIGLVLQGQRGSGKTHLLGWVRELVQANGGFFFLVSLLDADAFWPSLAASLTEGLSRPSATAESQLRVMLRQLGSRIGAPRSVRRALAGEASLSRKSLDAFIDRLRGYDPLVGHECQETARALALLAARDPGLQEIAETYLQSVDDEEGDRPRWGMRRTPRGPQLIVRDLSWLIALTGPAVIAVDQIDTLIAQSAKRLDDSGHAGQDVMIERIAGGLMSLRERTRRTLTLVACIPPTWQLIKLNATDTVQDRFREITQLKTIPNADLARLLIEKRFAVNFAEVGFRPPYPTWPVSPGAFQDAPGYTPRQLLIEIDRHVQECLLHDQVSELERLGPPPVSEPSNVELVPAIPLVPQLAPLDERFQVLQADADVAAALDEDTEDEVVPALLAAGLTAWVIERAEAGGSFTVDPPPGPKPLLHARLRRTLDESTEDQQHWAFRAVAAISPTAALNRLRKACTAAGLAEGVPKRRLFILRSRDWSAGPKTQEALDAFVRAGGAWLPLPHSDVRTLSALRVLFTENPLDLHAWLRERRPASRLVIFCAALKEAAGESSSGPADDDDQARPAPTPDDTEPTRGAHPPHTGSAGVLPGRSDTAPVRSVARGAERASTGRSAAATPDRQPTDRSAGAALPIGLAVDGGRPVELPLEALRKHTAIFAGTGSGKTVLIRRLVEECALHGVSAIVLDPNNDLARLGDRWPHPPPAWGPGDSDKATRYLAGTDIVVWTPRRESGRPLSFHPLPDFASVRDDPDEFAEAVEAAVVSIAPRAKLTGATVKAQLGEAVLRSAIEYYGRRGDSSLRQLIELLSDLPAGISGLAHAPRIAAELAQTLTAAMVNDPLFGGHGTAADPGVLLRPADGKRARVSIVSFVGLPSEDQRQSFVNQLQMALFAWIRKHPAGDRPLGGLFVMDEAQTLAPSGAMTACTQSTLALASQARKYGLGLVFATQAPKGIHNRIPGNAATQFYGLLNSPVQIAAAREMAAAKGGDVPDISLLRAGEFYVAVEGAHFVKVRTPLCLSYHPRSPLTTEEVLHRARRGIAGTGLQAAG